MSYDPIDMQAQADGKQEEQAFHRQQRETEIKDLRWLLSSRRGRRILWRILALSGTFRLSFDANALKMAFNEGNRNLGNRLFDELMAHCPEAYPAMVREYQEDERSGNGPKSK